MKIIFLLANLLLMIQISVYSQSLSLSDSQGPIPNNSTVTPHGTSSDDEIVAYAFVTNNSAAAIPVKVKKVEIHLTEGTTNTFCWGLCYPPNIYVSEEAITIGPGSTNFNDFSGHLAPNGISGYSIIRYVFYNENNAADSVCMNVHFDHFPVSVESRGTTPSLSAAYPNPANGTFSLDYQLPQSLTGSVILCTLAGSVVKEQLIFVAAGKVTINTGDLVDGVYLYSLKVNGTTFRIRKVIIKH
jgi:hypothetical protein